MGFSARLKLAAAGLLMAAAAAMPQSRAFASPPTLYTYSFSIGGAGYLADGIIFDGHNIWVAVETNQGTGQLLKLNQVGQVLSTTAVGVDPVEMAFDGANIWVTNYDSSTISVVNESGQLLNTLYLPAGWDPEGILFDGRFMWVENNGIGANTVSKFDAPSMTLIGNYPVGLSPDGAAFDGTYVWVTNSYSDNVMKLDRNTGAVVRSYPTGTFPLSILYIAGNVWVGNGASIVTSAPPLTASSLTELRAYGGVNLGTFNVGNVVRGLAFDGTSIWACNSLDNTVSLVRAADGAPMGTYAAGSSPRGIAFDGARMWIADSASNTVTVITPSSAQVVISPPVGVYTPTVKITPQPLPPIGGNLPLDVAAMSSQPLLSPGVAALGGILSELLNDN